MKVTKASFTEQVRAQTQPYWEGSFRHPFLTELQAGTLPLAKFRYYLIQDGEYLRHFAHLYQVVADRTDIPALRKQMQTNAMQLAAGELLVRQTFFEELGIGATEIAATAIAPTTYHYVSHLYRQFVEANEIVAAASLLPCSWLYFEIGQALQQASEASPVSYYQQWIETYGGEEARVAIEQECQLLNQLYEKSSIQQQQQMIQAFVISAKMEFAFWDMAYQLETWPVGIKEEKEV